MVFEYIDYTRLGENHYSNILDEICCLVILFFRVILPRMMESPRIQSSDEYLGLQTSTFVL